MTTEVANRIRNLRTELDLSQRDLASVLEVRQATISEWETGNAKPSRGNLRLLADLCHDSRAVYRWLLGEGARPRLQPYSSELGPERTDAAATYGFRDETKGDESDLQETAEKLLDQLEACRSLLNNLEERLPEEGDSSQPARRQTVQAARRALDGAYHAITATRDLLPDQGGDEDG